MNRWLRPRAAILSASILFGGTFVATAMTAKAADPVVLINAGGPAITDADGHDWDADSYAVGGAVGETNDTISGTRYQNIFKNERYGMSAYRIPVANGTY